MQLEIMARIANKNILKKLYFYLLNIATYFSPLLKENNPDKVYGLAD